MDIERLSEVITQGVKLRQVEPHVYSAYPTDNSGSAYDRPFGNIYEIVACNRLYNRILWGYWPKEFQSMAQEALGSDTEGWVLDAGCGSLAFTAEAYSKYSRRPVVLLDNSIKLLRMAKARITRLCGHVPDGMVFLHADAMSMPFKPAAFRTIIAQNLLHAVSSAEKLIGELKVALAPGGTVSMTTLIENNRFSDSYLRMLADKGLLVGRGLNDIQGLFTTAGMKANIRTQGNMAFILIGKQQDSP